MTQDDKLEQLLIAGIQERKGRNITVVDMGHIESAAASKFIIAEGTSSTHVEAIVDCVRDYLLEKEYIKPYNYDGYQASEWIVIDYGHILVHIFMPEARSRYRLEKLWSDAVIREIPDLD